MAQTLVFDVEADGLLDTVSTVWCIGIADVSDLTRVDVYTDHDPKYQSLSHGIGRLLAADRLVAHNGVGYDLPALAKVLGAQLDFSKLWDTMVVGGLLWPTRGLLSLDSFGTELGMPKGSHSEWHRYSPEMVEYMAQDVQITAALYGKELSECRRWKAKNVDLHDAVDLEHAVQVPLSAQMDHGFRLDLAAAEELELELRAEIDLCERELLSIYLPQIRPEKGEWCFRQRTWTGVRTFSPKGNNKTHGYVANAPFSKIKVEMLNPGSRLQCAQRLSSRYGWRPSEFTPSGQAKIDEKVLSEINHPEAEVMARYFTLNKQLSQLADGETGWLKVVRPTGYVHGYIRSNGARTYRMSHSRPNMANVNKKETRMRAVWLPDPEQELVGVDAKGLEMRMLASYLFPWDNGQYGIAAVSGDSADGTDPHSLNQRAVGLYDRDSAKTFFYAMVYGALDPKLGSVVLADAEKMGKPRPTGSVAAIGKRARASIEAGITGLGELIAAVQGRARTRGYVLLPDGRPCETGVRNALNSLLQGGGSIVMKKALALFHFEVAPERGLSGRYSYCANVHDEVQLSAEPEVSDLVGQAFADSIQLAGERLGLAVPMAGDVKIGLNWSQTH